MATDLAHCSIVRRLNNVGGEAYITGGHFVFVFRPADPSAQCRARVRVKTPLFEAQDCRFFVVIQFSPADALLRPETGGDQGTLFARNVVQSYVRVCVSSFSLVCCSCSTSFQLNTSPPRGAVGEATFHPAYFSFPCLTRRHADGPRRF